MRMVLVRRAAASVAVIVMAAAAIVASAPGASAATPSGYGFAGITDWDGDGHQDIVAVDANGVLWLYPGESVRGYSTQGRYQIGNGWYGYSFAGIGDWDGDGHQDIVARDSGGLLWLYPGESVRGYSTQGRYQIGNGWSQYNFTGIADWDLDGHQDIVTFMHYFTPLWLFPGESTRAYSSQGRIQIGHRQGISYSGVSDWDADGHQDVIVRNPAGQLWFHAGNGTRTNSIFAGAPGEGVQIGNGWNGYTIAGLADWDADGHQDIVAVDANGVLWLYPGESVRGYSGQERVQIGTGW